MMRRHVNLVTGQHFSQAGASSSSGRYAGALIWRASSISNANSANADCTAGLSAMCRVSDRPRPEPIAANCGCVVWGISTVDSPYVFFAESTPLRLQPFSPTTATKAQLVA